MLPFYLYKEARGGSEADANRLPVCAFASCPNEVAHFECVALRQAGGAVMVSYGDETQP